MSGQVIGILSLTDPGGKLESGDSRDILRCESDLAHVLRDRGYTVPTGGMTYPEEDRIAPSSSLARRHVHTMMDWNAQCVILNVCGGGRAGEAVETVRYLERELRAPCRLIVWGDADRRPDCVESVFAISGALHRNGLAHTVMTGSVGDPAFIDDLVGHARFNCTRHGVQEKVIDVIARLKRQKLLAFGSTLDRRGAEGVDPDRAMQVFGVGVEDRRSAALEERAAGLRGDGIDIPDARIVAASRRLGEGLVEELSRYHAALDLVREAEATCAIVDGETSWMAAAWLSNHVGPDGDPKDILPCATRADMDTVLTQLVLALYTGEPSGFATFTGVGEFAARIGHPTQLPPHFFGDTLVVDAVSRRMRGSVEPHRQFTLARFGRERGRMTVRAVEVETTGEGEAGTTIPVRLPVPSSRLLGRWPAATTAISFGYHAGFLAELAHRLDIGFDVVDSAGRRFYRVS